MFDISELAVFLFIMYNLTKLKPEHLGGLPYDKVLVNTAKGVYLAHSYLEQDIQRRAWEVYGGPSGLNARKDQYATLVYTYSC